MSTLIFDTESTVVHARIQNQSKRVIFSILIPEEGLARPTTMKATETALEEEEEESDEEEEEEEESDEEEEEEPRTEAESEKDKEEVRKEDPGSTILHIKFLKKRM